MYNRTLASAYTVVSAHMESLVLVAFLAVALTVGVPASGTQEKVSVCAIRANPERYLGKVVTITASYATDSSNYEFLEDPSCSNGTLDIGFRVPERDESVDAFKEAQEALCKSRGTPYLCVLEGVVTVRGEIAETTGAHLQPDLTYQIVNLHSVANWEFKDGR